MRSTHPAIKDARRALEQELEALKSRIRIRRDSKLKGNVSEPGGNQSKSPNLRSASERAGENTRVKQIRKRHEPPERSLQNEPTTQSPMDKRQQARDYPSTGMTGKAGRVFRWFKGLFRW